MYVWMYVRTYALTHARTHARTHVCACVCACVRMCVRECVCSCVRACMYNCTCIVYESMYVCIYVCMHVCRWSRVEWNTSSPQWYSFDKTGGVHFCDEESDRIPGQRDKLIAEHGAHTEKDGARTKPRWESRWESRDTHHVAFSDILLRVSCSRRWQHDTLVSLYRGLPILRRIAHKTPRSFQWYSCSHVLFQASYSSLGSIGQCSLRCWLFFISCHDKSVFVIVLRTMFMVGLPIST